MTNVSDIESIKQLKYRYFRFLDQKKMDDLEQLLLPDCSADYHNGHYSYPNREKLMEFLRDGCGRRDLLLTMHQGHHPEIELISETEATGIWYLQDIVINLRTEQRLEGNGFYEDRYRKVDGNWKFAHTGYKRTFEITKPIGEITEFYNGFEEGAF